MNRYSELNTSDQILFRTLLDLTFRFFGIKMFVIAAAVYIENTAQSCDSMFMAQKMHSIALKIGRDFNTTFI